MAPTTTPASLSDQRLTKVQTDLTDCRKLLMGWYDSTEASSGTEETLHDAVEALVRAVATLAEVIGDQQA